VARISSRADREAKGVCSTKPSEVFLVAACGGQHENQVAHLHASGRAIAVDKGSLSPRPFGSAVQVSGVRELHASTVGSKGARITCGAYVLLRGEGRRSPSEFCDAETLVSSPSARLLTAGSASGKPRRPARLGEMQEFKRRLKQLMVTASLSPPALVGKSPPPSAGSSPRTWTPTAATTAAMLLRCTSQREHYLPRQANAIGLAWVQGSRGYGRPYR
jgi:hypothetical protein